MKSLKFLYIFLILGLVSSFSFATPTPFTPVTHNYRGSIRLGDYFTLDYSREVNGVTRFTIINKVPGASPAGNAAIGSIFFITTTYGQRGLEISNPVIDDADADNTSNTGVDFYLKKQIADMPNIRNESFFNTIDSVYLFSNATGNGNQRVNGLINKYANVNNAADRDQNNAVGDSRIETGEEMTISFNTGDYDISKALNSRELIIGLHVQSLPGFNSDLFVNQTDAILIAYAPPAVPTPGAALLAISGLGLIFKKRKMS